MSGCLLLFLLLFVTNVREKYINRNAKAFVSSCNKTLHIFSLCFIWHYLKTSGENLSEIWKQIFFNIQSSFFLFPSLAFYRYDFCLVSSLFFVHWLPYISGCYIWTRVISLIMSPFIFLCHMGVSNGYIPQKIAQEK